MKVNTDVLTVSIVFPRISLRIFPEKFPRQPSLYVPAIHNMENYG
jgi:hypothetical protein